MHHYWNRFVSDSDVCFIQRILFVLRYSEIRLWVTVMFASLNEYCLFWDTVKSDWVTVFVSFNEYFSFQNTVKSDCEWQWRLFHSTNIFPSKIQWNQTVSDSDVCFIEWILFVLRYSEIRLWVTVTFVSFNEYCLFWDTVKSDCEWQWRLFHSTNIVGSEIQWNQTVSDSDVCLIEWIMFVLRYSEIRLINSEYCWIIHLHWLRMELNLRETKVNLSRIQVKIWKLSLIFVIS